MKAFSRAWMSPTMKRAVIGVPSSSASSSGHHHPAAYNLFSIARSHEGWRIGQTVRGFVNETSPDRITDIERKELIAP